MHRLSRLIRRLNDDPIITQRRLDLAAMTIMIGAASLLPLIVFAALTISRVKREEMQTRHRDAVLTEMTDRSREVPCLAAQGCDR